MIIAFVTVLFASTALASTAEVDIFPQESTAVVDSYTAYELRIENTGTTEDRYRISSDYADEIDIAPTRIPETGNIEPGESETAQIWFNPDLDREEGRYDFTVTATSSATGEEYSVNGVVEVVRDHDVNLDVESPGAVCRGEDAVYQVYVSNDGSQEETFRINPDAGDISLNRVTVEAGETETLTLTRSSELAVNDRAFNIEAVSASSYADDMVSTSFVVENCYETTTDIEPESQESAVFTEASFDVTVSNEGTRSVNAEITPSAGEVEDEEVNIASGEEFTTELQYVPEEVGTEDITVNVEGRAPSSAKASLEVYNGQDVELNFPEETSICENTNFEKEVTVENTGEASDTYSVEVNRGELSESEISLDPGETRTLDVELNSSDYDQGQSYDLEVSATAQRLGAPQVSSTSSFTVENCWDLDMDIVEDIESAGENRSVIYEISLQNTGTQVNTYVVSVDAPEWITVRPGEITVPAGETEKSYIYAGIPFNQTGTSIDITATATGEQVEKSQTVQLVVGEEVKDSVDSPEGGGIPGAFSRAVSGLFQGIAATGNVIKLFMSIMAGLIVSALILYREW